MGHDWHGAPATAAFVHGSTDHAEVEDHFVEAVLNHLHAGAPRPHSWRGFGGFRAQVAGGARQGRAGASCPDSRNGVDHDPFTLKLIVGTREDITARNWDSLPFEQQY